MDFKQTIIPAKGRAIYGIAGTSTGSISLGGGSTGTGGSGIVTGDTPSQTQTINVINNLTSNSTTDALSANQGRVLKSLINTQSEWYNIHSCKTNDVFIKVRMDDYYILSGNNTQYLYYDNGNKSVIYKSGTTDYVLFKYPNGNYTYTKTNTGSTTYAKYSKTVSIGRDPDNNNEQTGYTVQTATTTGQTSSYVSPFKNVAGRPSVVQDVSVVKTLVDNPGDIFNNSNYRYVLLRWKKTPGMNNDWRVPMFSPLWLRDKDDGSVVTKASTQCTQCDIIWEDCSWPIIAGKTQMFANTKELPVDALPTSIEPGGAYPLPLSDDGINWHLNGVVRKRFHNNRNVKMIFGVAIYKKTNSGKFKWQRVSNIAPVQLFVKQSGDIIVKPLPND